MKRGKDTALVIHPLTKVGGAEKMFKEIARAYPEADIFTAYYDSEIADEFLRGRNIFTSFLQWFPFKLKLQKEIVPLLPFAYRSLNLKKYKKVIILSDGFEKMVRYSEDAKSLLIVMTPPRFLYLESRHMEGSKKPHYLLYEKLMKGFFHKKWIKADKAAVLRSKKVLAISQTVQQRVSENYGVHSEILNPPVEIENFTFVGDLRKREDWYLYLGRVEGYKGVELIIRAGIKAKKKIIIAGDGDDLPRLKGLVDQLQGRQFIDFIGFVSEEMKFELLSKCKALIFPVKDEDFGIVPIEANASGCPVIAYKSGGARETIIEGANGVLFDSYDTDSLVAAIEKLEIIGITPESCLEESKKYSRIIFESKLITYMNGLGKR